MQSLRVRKPTESQQPPKVQRSASRLIRARDGRRSTRVDEKMKRRMSTRYADISSPTEASVPAVPSLPIGIQPSPVKQHEAAIPEVSSPVEDPRVTEARLLDEDDFDPDAYLKVKMANSTEAELKTMQSSLRAQRDMVAKDLQHDVFKNYAEFVQISKEVSVIENEMLEFKECLAEWKGMPSLLHIEESASAVERRRNVRSSIADLRVLYANQMQTLHSQIEGSSKFVPITPGRHVVSEMDNILALNPATYKVDHPVRFVIVDDAVLVARIRRRRNNAESDKQVAERCWPLNEMLVLDTKDTGSMTNVFKIRHGKETHVYRTEISADKRHLLQTFRQVAEELSAKKRKEREGEHLRRKSLWGGDRNSAVFGVEPMPAMPPIPGWMADLIGQSEVGSDAKDKVERDARWIGDFCDDLTVSISLREWDKAVELVEQGEAQLTSMPSLGAKLASLKASLTTALLQALSQPSNRKSAVTRLSALLVRLKAGAAARSAFLAAREDLMHRRLRMIRFEGDIEMYVGDLAVVVFTGIKHTADWYLSSFKENDVASFFIEWAKKQVEFYAEVFQRQVYGSDIDQQTIDEAIKITHLQSRRSLEEYGIDFRFLLDKLLLEAQPSNHTGPPPFKPHKERERELIHARPATPIRQHARLVFFPGDQRDIASVAHSELAGLPDHLASTPVIVCGDDEDNHANSKIGASQPGAASTALEGSGSTGKCSEPPAATCCGTEARGDVLSVYYLAV
ncbi:uncharacterized protein LAESUDRAFT_815521 [Laetiporus sulphureus 93-53]|uniref:Exocyst complex component EXO84 n=1 Tax=Laetiporus sulphureus 93-53 TaxID=1314785 RepID=A0A165C268_9APHY|nr:uncharacterized protein LAESUDRAFT_815521 [Laetiporus sulphureus 93-53]KZT02064.1 hypothetical protein LAESUDRAFT_815521 [Laetiporus sulphureus 93-53]